VDSNSAFSSAVLSTRVSLEVLSYVYLEVSMVRIDLLSRIQSQLSVAPRGPHATAPVASYIRRVTSTPRPRARPDRTEDVGTYCCIFACL
jgi:hypothetical protein